MLAMWKPNIYVLASVLAFSSGLLTALAVFINAKDRRAAKPFMLLLCMASLWCTFPLLLSLPLDHEILLNLGRATHIFGAFAAPAFLHLTFEITQDERRLLHKIVMSATYLMAAIFALLVFHPAFVTDIVKYAPHFSIISGPIYHVYVAYYFVVALIAHTVTIRVLLVGPEALKNQIRYFLVGMAIMSVGPFLFFTGAYYGIEPFPHDLVIPIFAGITGYAIIRHQLMDIRVVIRKSLIYSGLVACMTGLYLMLVIVMERFFQNILGYESIVATAAAGFLIAVFFNPVRGRVQTVIDRALFKATPPELAEQKERFVSEMRKGDQMKAVGTLAAGLAHEIRNPLSSIKTFVEHLESRKSDPEFIAKFQRVVGAEVERINHIVQELLEFAKPQPPRLERVDLPKVIDETLDLMNNELLKRHVEVHRQYGSAAPISGDPQKLRQVFLNLFLNGLEAMNGAGGKLEIGIRSEGTALQVSVRDSGQGIAEKDLPHVREPFFSSKPNGTGLGLAVVEGIIRDHGGKVKINSQPGQGTEVQICLPLKNQLDL